MDKSYSRRFVRGGNETARFCAVISVSEVGRSGSEIDMSMRVYICRGAGNCETLFEEMHRWGVAGDAMLLPIKRREKAKKSAKALKKIKNIEKSS